MPDANDVGFYAGQIPVLLVDVARAIAVHDANGEAMADDIQRLALIQDARDILDRSFRYAQQRRLREKSAE